MEVEPGAHAPSAGYRVNNLGRVAANKSAVTERKVVDHIAVDQRRHILRAAPVVVPLMIRILRESPSRNGLCLEVDVVSELAEEARRIAETFRPGVDHCGMGFPAGSLSS